MADHDSDAVDTSGDLLKQVYSQINKSAKESVVKKLKEVVIKIEDSKKVTRALELEAEKIVADFKAGVL